MDKLIIKTSLDFALYKLVCKQYVKILSYWVYKVSTICYTVSMNCKYLVKKVGKYTFKFKLDLNPTNNQYEPHIWHRHLITPDDAIRAFFTITEEEWNERYKRYEAYSADYDITLYYMKLKEKDSYVFIITAFSDWR